MNEIDENNKHMTRTERRKLHNEKRRLEKEMDRQYTLRRKNQNKIKKYGIMLLTLIVLASFAYAISIPSKDAPIIEINSDRYDFGLVSQKKGEVSATMILSNKGSKDLIINNMDTSCGCTSASIISNGDEGPKFSMSTHGTNPKNWEQTVKPGESVRLRIYYDPDVHRELRETVTRSVFLYTNDPRNPVKEVRITATQTD